VYHNKEVYFSPKVRKSVKSERSCIKSLFNSFIQAENSHKYLKIRLYKKMQRRKILRPCIFLFGLQALYRVGNGGFNGLKTYRKQRNRNCPGAGQHEYPA